MTNDENIITTKAGRREWVALIVLTLPCLLISMDLSVLHLAVPVLSADLRPSSTELLWIVDIYGFLLAGSLVTMGNLGDRVGRRRLLMIGAAGFGVTSIVAAFSTSAIMLIAARAMMGVAAATLMPSTLALIRNMFDDPTQRATAVAVWATSLSLGGAVGPLAGGALLEFFWWGSVLLIAVPVMLLLLVLAPALVTESRDPDAGPLDVRSAVLSVVATLAAVYAIKNIAADGLEAHGMLAGVLAAVTGLAFLRRQRRLTRPLVDIGLFRIPAFSVSLGSNALGFAVLFGVDLFLVQYLQLVLGLSPLHAGLLTLPMFVAFMAGGMLAPLLLRRVRSSSLLSSGLALAALGMAILTQVGGPSGLAVFLVGSVVFSLGLAPVFALATDMTIGSAPSERAGAASAISETSTELGGALGIAVIGTLGTGLYRAGMSDQVPSGARDSLGAAVALAQRLPARSAELLDSAQHAFVTALQLTAGISAAILTTGAIVVAVVLRQAKDAAEARDTNPAGPVAGRSVAQPRVPEPALTGVR